MHVWMITRVEQIVTAAHRLVTLHTDNEPWSNAKNQVSVTYFTGQNRLPNKVSVRHYQASWGSQPTGCLFFVSGCTVTSGLLTVVVSYSDDCYDGDSTTLTTSHGFLSLVPRVAVGWNDVLTTRTCEWKVVTDPGRSITVSWTRPTSGLYWSLFVNITWKLKMCTVGGVYKRARCQQMPNLQHIDTQCSRK